MKTATPKTEPSPSTQLRKVVFGDSLFFHHCRAMISRLFPEQPLDAAAMEPLAEHITRFSLAGIKDYARTTTSRH